MKDFLIVGRGLAATCLMHQFYKNDLSFDVIGNSQLSASSKVAAGIWNPIVFKRLTSSWKANELIPKLLSFYSDCEKTLNQKLISTRALLKPFTEEQEKKLWLNKSQNELHQFLDNRIYSAEINHQHLKIINQFGLVKQAGNLNLNAFILASELFFKDHITEASFDHQELIINNNGLSYKNKKAKNIIFCEGYLVKNNPFFNWIPLVPAKGEIITIKTHELKLHDFIFNRDGFLMDIGENLYKVGATYDWKDLNDIPKETGLQTLQKKLEAISNCNYQVIKHEAGVRPSSKDRRPIIGAHPKYANIFVFNGLGSKGVMLAPFFTENFVHFYQQKEMLHTEVDVKRFYHLYESFA